MKRILTAIIIMTCIIQYACKKDSSGSSGQPVISGVRSIDTTKRDSLFAEAMPGRTDSNTR